MTGVKSLKFIFLLLAMAGIIPSASGDPVVKESNGVRITYNVMPENTIEVLSVTNNSKYRIMLKIDGTEGPEINKNNTVQVGKKASRSVAYTDPSGTKPNLWTFRAPKKAPAEAPELKEEKTEKTETPERAPEAPVSSREAASAQPAKPEPRRDAPASMTTAARSGSDVAVIDRINQDLFFGQEAVNAFVRKCGSLVDGLSQADDKTRFIADNDMRNFITLSESELKMKKEEIPTIVSMIISSSKSSESLVNLVTETLYSRLADREQALQKLKSAVDSVGSATSASHSFKDNLLNYGIVTIIVLVILIWMVMAIIKRKKGAKTKVASKPAAAVAATATPDGNPAIVVRRRTTSILKKQCLDDVIGNPAYMAVSSSEFVPDSAVGTIYIKNTCIKEVYNLYAEDLRNSENPKEDGCMVLGRWVFNEAAGTYNVSLEEVVFPGDDAVFKEYELNFGGKIKLRVAERLRKLRRDTNHQYDLVCWIHSHPGLGVFFSNSDDGVQMQLKHPQHPNFLTAFVVDILTSDQDMGIFTFRKDGSMNSKNDLTKMYSLEQMYKWALESDKTTFNTDNFYNILSEAKQTTESCHGIELNNNSIIDLAQMVVEPATGIIGWAVGAPMDSNAGREYIISSIVKASEKPTAGVMGAVINVTHFSLPTIQRMVAGESAGLNFVMVYSSKFMTLTTIPVAGGRLITDEQYYGDETIDDLKIWTRRKR